MPSLIWVPFGLRETEDFTFPVGPVLEKAGVYAAGVAANVAPPEKTPVACGVPKTGYLSEEMARVVAHTRGTLAR
jgi:sulfide:quinone oxidoreductase